MLFTYWRDTPFLIVVFFLRIQVNYQYRHGTSFPVALRTIYADGGIPRFYRGVIPALAQGPLSRFGDTAANTGMLTLLDSFEVTKDLNVGYKTVAASIAAGLFRIVLMPVVCMGSILFSCSPISAVLGPFTVFIFISYPFLINTPTI
jgi:hypothetical protein